MAWSDEPTENQLGAIYSFFKWQMPFEKAQFACKYLESHATRRDVSDEIKRVKTLYHENKLNECKCFDAPIWEDFEYEPFERN